MKNAKRGRSFDSIVCAFSPLVVEIHIQLFTIIWYNLSFFGNGPSRTNCIGYSALISAFTFYWLKSMRPVGCLEVQSPHGRWYLEEHCWLCIVLLKRTMSPFHCLTLCFLINFVYLSTFFLFSRTLCQQNINKYSNCSSIQIGDDFFAMNCLFWHVASADASPISFDSQ